VQHPPRKLLAGRRVKIRIAIASGLALAIGGWLTPRAALPTLPAPQEHAAPLLEEQVQLREAGRTFAGVQDVAAQVREHTVGIALAARVATSRRDFAESVDSIPEVAGFGVFVSASHVLAHSAPLAGRTSVPLSIDGGGTMEGRVVAYEPSTGLVLLDVEPAARRGATFATDAPPAGALVVGVGRAETRDIAVPVFVTSSGGDMFTIGAANGILPGMPLFTLAGELFAIAAPDGPAGRAIPARAAAERLLARVAAGERRSAFGLAFQPPAGALARIFGESGVIVTDVLEGGPADAAGIQVGDVILAVGNMALDSADTAARVLGSATIDTPVRVQLRRAARVREVDVTPAPAYEVAALARTRGERPTGPQARLLLAPQVLEEGAIPPAAAVLSINGRAVTSRAQAQRELRRARTPAAVLVQHEDDPFFVAVETQR
jgi:S1-C subfamily serine protease